MDQEQLSERMPKVRDLAAQNEEALRHVRESFDKLEAHVLIQALETESESGAERHRSRK